MEKIFYLAQVCGSLSALSKVIMIISTIVCVLSAILYCCANEDYDETEVKVCSKLCKISLLFVIISTLLVVFVPDKKTFLFMVGGYVVDSVVEDHPNVKEIPGNTLDLLNEYIKTTTEELKYKKNSD